MKKKLSKYVVEYRTYGGRSYTWEGEAVDKVEAEFEALNQSFTSMNFDDHLHSIISTYQV